MGESYYKNTKIMYNVHQRALVKVSNDIQIGSIDQGSTWITKLYTLIDLLKKVVHEKCI